MFHLLTLLALVGELTLGLLHLALIGLVEFIVLLDKLNGVRFFKRLAHKEALNVVALHFSQEVILTDGLNTLRYSMDAQIVDKIDNRVGDSIITLIVVDLVNKGFVYFKTLDGEILKLVK